MTWDVTYRNIDVIKSNKYRDLIYQSMNFTIDNAKDKQQMIIPANLTELFVDEEVHLRVTLIA